MDTIEVAETAFANRDWASVQRLLANRAELADSARGLEILAASAWWMDDIAEAIACRERLFSLRRAADDTAGAASVAVQLAWDNTMGRRDTAIASGWAARARSLLDGAEPCADHAWLMLREETLAGSGSEAFAAARRLAASVGSFDAEMTA